MKPNLKNPRPYCAYIDWLQSQDLDAAEAFLRKQLKGFTQPTPLIVDRPTVTIDETYQYYEDLPFDCPSPVFGGLDDPEMSRTDLEAWQGQTSRQFLIKMFSGDHFFLHTAKECLLSELSRELSQYV